MKPSTVMMRRVGGMLHPFDERAAKLLRRIPPKVPIAVRVLRHRSPEQQSMYWSVLSKVVEATGRWRTAEELHTALKIAVGYVDVVQLIDGRRVLIPQSTAFDQMTQDEFQSYMDAALRVVCNEILDGISIDELLDHSGVKRAA